VCICMSAAVTDGIPALIRRMSTRIRRDSEDSEDSSFDQQSVHSARVARPSNSARRSSSRHADRDRDRSRPRDADDRDDRAGRSASRSRDPHDDGDRRSRTLPPSRSRDFEADQHQRSASHAGSARYRAEAVWCSASIPYTSPTCDCPCCMEARSCMLVRYLSVLVCGWILDSLCQLCCRWCMVYCVLCTDDL